MPPIAIHPEKLFASPNALARHYSRFAVERRLLLTGHSHQAWPDVAFDGQVRAILDAAELVDDKWKRAFEAANAVREGYRRLLDDPQGLYSLASSTHDLLIKLLSALPWRERRKVVTTDSEFYSLDRLLRRLEEEGVERFRAEFDTDSMTIGAFRGQYIITLHPMDATEAIYQIRETRPAR